MSAGGGVNTQSVAGIMRDLAWLACQRDQNPEYPYNPQLELWRHFILTGQDQSLVGGQSQLCNFTVPPNLTWVIYHVAILLSVSADNSVPGGVAGFWFSDNNSTLTVNPYGARDMQVWFENENAVPYFGLPWSIAMQGQQMLVVFSSGNNVRLAVNPRLAGAATAQTLYSAISGFLVPPEVGGRLADHSTQWVVNADGY